MDASQMTAKLEYVAIDRLEHYVGKKVCASICICSLASREVESGVTPSNRCTPQQDLYQAPYTVQA